MSATIEQENQQLKLSYLEAFKKKSNLTGVWAQMTADDLTAGELDGWTYKVEPHPHDADVTLLAVYDETGRFVAYW